LTAVRELKEAVMRLIGDFAEWLIGMAARETNVADLHRLFCERLVSIGIPLWRSSLGLEVLSPEIDGSQFRWVARQVETRLMPRGSDYSDSPGRVAEDTGNPYRRRLDTPVSDMPLLEELRQMGATDYYIIPLPFIDRQRTAHISFATLNPEGFTDADLATLNDAALIFSPCAERFVLRQIAIDLLTTYVGRRSAAKIYEGALDRGNRNDHRDDPDRRSQRFHPLFRNAPDRQCAFDAE
jgi:adenylate cyclase